MWFIKDLLDKKGEVSLFTRPRRFGKTLNLSMLKYFFEKPVDGADTGILFKGMKIMDAGEKYTREMQQYPVITLTLKSAKQPTWELAYILMKREICSEYQRHQFILDDQRMKAKEERYRRIMSENGDPGDYVDALKFLSECLSEYYQKKTIILIDEYDVPLENAYYAGFYGQMETMKEWYDGYLFGTSEVYNPWSVINYVDKLCANEQAFPAAAWSNTSSNSIVKELIYRADEVTKGEIELLVNGGTIEKQVHEDITYEDIYTSEDNLWNFLYFTGYLKACTKRMDMDNIYVTFALPNREIRSIFVNTVMNWFREGVKKESPQELYRALLSGEQDIFEGELNSRLQNMISFMDGKEAFYHGFVLGLLGSINCIVISNREAGEGEDGIQGFEEVAKQFTGGANRRLLFERFRQLSIIRLLIKPSINIVRLHNVHKGM